METTSGIRNVTQFRLLGTPYGDLLIRFFWLELNPDAVNWHIAERLVSGDLARPILYEGSLVNNHHDPTAIDNLLKRVVTPVNCVRIEQRPNSKPWPDEGVVIRYQRAVFPPSSNAWQPTTFVQTRIGG